jgi:PTS system mannose-specific IIA component
MIVTFIIAHEDLSFSLVQTVESVLGKQESFFPYSNKHDSLQLLAQRIKNQIQTFQANDIVCFTDLKGGSCWTLANILRKEIPNITVISGVNLPMLITYFNNLNELPFKQLIDKVINDACRSITIAQGE